ncbi:MAG: hypothetical protein HY423_15860 [Candidatus Lambdaproteobacteria bacterium]|nr:hypothetical protein [Candidatus Lambdaproteobacteria bacterium]
MSLRFRSLLFWIPASFLIVAFSLYITWPVISSEDQVAAVGGDGFGTIGVIGSAVQLMDENGIVAAILTFDPTAPYVAPNLRPPSVAFSKFWTIYSGLVGLMFGSASGYDVIVLVSLVLNGLAALWLARSAGLGLVASAFVSLSVLVYQHPIQRSVGHLSLVTFFPLMLLLAQGWILAERMTRGRIFLLVLLLILTFQINEYYGYFGAWGVAVLVITRLFLRWAEGHDSPLKVIQTHIASIVLGVALLIVLFVLLWPQVFLAKMLGTGGALAARRFDRANFFTFGADHALYVFSPGLSLFKQGALTRLTTRVWEFATFRVGFAYGVLAMIALLTAIVMAVRRVRRLITGRTILIRIRVLAATPEAQFVLPWFVLLLVGMSLGVQPDRWWALSKVTMAIGPMFRVSARAYILCTISIFMIGGWLIHKLLSHRSSSDPGIGRPALGAGLAVFMTTVAIADHLGGFKLPQISGVQLPAEELRVARYLAPLPDGMVLNLPYWSEDSGDVPETNYNYIMQRALHKKKILNGARGAVGSRLKQLTEKVDGSLIDFLGHAGVRYLVVWRNQQFPYTPRKPVSDDAIRRDPRLKLHLNTDGAAVYEVAGSAPWDANNFIRRVSEVR